MWRKEKEDLLAANSESSLAGPQALSLARGWAAFWAPQQLEDKGQVWGVTL